MSSRWAVALLLSLAGCTRQSPAPEQANATAEAPVPKAGAIDRAHRGAALPKAVLTDLDGKAFAPPPGQPMLVNLWATWCAPCIAEMPTLDHTAGDLAGKLTVVAVNQGDDGAKVKAFLAGKPLAHARPLLDKAMTVSLSLGANLPTTILYDAAGHEVWRASGGRDWSSPASLKLLGEAGLGLPTG